MPDGAVRCPELSCRVALTGGDVDAAVDAATATQFRERALAALVAKSGGAEGGLSCCPSPGCPFVFAWDAANRRLDCPLCKQRHCLVCRSDWHPGVRCEARAAPAAAAAAATEADECAPALALLLSDPLTPRAAA